MTALDTLARLLGLEARHAEPALYSERAARVALSRRGLLAGGAALMATGTAFSFGAPEPEPELYTWSAVEVTINGRRFPAVQLVKCKRGWLVHSYGPAGAGGSGTCFV